MAEEVGHRPDGSNPENSVALMGSGPPESSGVRCRNDTHGLHLHCTDLLLASRSAKELWAEHVLGGKSQSLVHSTMLFAQVV